MKIICAGYPKTGSKSCSSALRILGFKVADYMETLEFLSHTWADHINGKIPIEQVIAEYDKHGFDANQDIPGNFMWEQLYRALPKDTKVILTVRESEEKWWASWSGFMRQEAERGSIMGLSLQAIMDYASRFGYLGPKFAAMSQVSYPIISRYVIETATEPAFTVTKIMEVFGSKNGLHMRQGYRKHNLNVMDIVPKENLLIWKVKDGWKPLCDFLGKPIPNEPIPHDNRTGDTKFAEEYAFKTKMFKDAQNYFAMYIALDCVKLGILGYVVWKERKSGGTWLRGLLDMSREKILSLIKV